MVNQTRIIMVSLILVILILGSVVLYSFVIKPKINGYVVAKQSEGVLIAVNAIISQIQQQGFVQIPVAEGQPPLILVPYQQPAGAQAPVETQTQ